MGPLRASTVREFVVVEGYVVAVGVHFQRLINQLSDRSQPGQSRSKQAQLRFAIGVRDEDYEPRMEFLCGVEPTKIARIVGDEDHVARQREGDNLPICPASSSEMREVVGFIAGALGFANERRAQALVDKKPHPSLSSRSGTVVVEISRQPAHGFLRGLPRSGCAAA